MEALVGVKMIQKGIIKYHFKSQKYKSGENFKKG